LLQTLMVDVRRGGQRGADTERQPGKAFEHSGQLKSKEMKTQNGGVSQVRNRVNDEQPVASELVPAGARSGLFVLSNKAGTAAQSSGSKLPRHRFCATSTDRHYPQRADPKNKTRSL
jgi:hypothetical protein